MESSYLDIRGATGGGQYDISFDGSSCRFGFRIKGMDSKLARSRILFDTGNTALRGKLNPTFLLKVSHTFLYIFIPSSKQSGSAMNLNDKWSIGFT